MDKSVITVTMPLTEFEALEAKANGLDELVEVLKRANPDGSSAVMTKELETRIKEIYI